MIDREKTTQLLALDAQLREAGIPIHGVGLGPPVTVDFTPEAIQQQKDQAAVIIKGFDWNTAPAEEEQNNKEKLFALMMTDFAEKNPGKIEEHGIDVDAALEA